MKTWSQSLLFVLVSLCRYAVELVRNLAAHGASDPTAVRNGGAAQVVESSLPIA
jgi:hypothetical protein